MTTVLEFTTATHNAINALHHARVRLDQDAETAYADREYERWHELFALAATVLSAGSNWQAVSKQSTATPNPGDWLPLDSLPAVYAALIDVQDFMPPSAVTTQAFLDTAKVIRELHARGYIS